MKFSKKKTQLLLALYEKKFDGRYYEISELLRNYEINISHEESYQIGQNLEVDGFIKLASSMDSVSAYITGEGVEFIGEYNFINEESEETSPKFNEEEIIIINRKLDELLEKISKIELGQNITYDDLFQEFEEMKVLSKKLSKKNWAEILQGKLVTIGLGKLTEKAVELISATFASQNLIN